MCACGCVGVRLGKEQGGQGAVAAATDDVAQLVWLWFGLRPVRNSCGRTYGLTAAVLLVVMLLRLMSRCCCVMCLAMLVIADTRV
jgi:hypothetical protein